MNMDYIEYTITIITSKWAEEKPTIQLVGLKGRIYEKI